VTKYIVNRRSWFPGLNLVEPGTPVEWDGLPGTNLDPVDDAGKKAKEEAARIRQASAAAVQAAQQIATSFQAATVAGFQPPETSFAAQATAEAPEAGRAKSGVLVPREQVPEGDTPGPSPSTGKDVPPDTTTFVPAGIVTTPGAGTTPPEPTATMPAAEPADGDDEEDEPAPPPRRRRKSPEAGEE